ncbi:hypothetical protein M2459_003480 [Parabacteroides sp. PF5-5]|uniref:FimB/Mfa2 family fimbrial subunit n=1 Tax=unclassified Parabacteroides TaxID=2649774 RepID=UPI002475AE3E|nr:MULTISPECIES: FimB/Mfa2 family fimbrial subunit [unclassified Parabacteroides]MDH6306893.1 hypothetical protein [Parabacteroides sp. PH5-39]MDH6317719.1 hypothetical protein [Parabacteroides sp. PF5-13]MDH6321591.1 hypothetical protein [Parabacteroides sp. PH5-13]MDH6325280.1 hypothetical protein [Parabacteroides sp. PH5-8]MDH6328904.1 hypothetical protein [Parabacteroides sp. PH5-41]
MRRLYKIIYLFPLALVFFFLLQSCVNDDLSDCFTEKRVYFKYTPATYGIEYKEGINPDEVTRMNLFIFDEDGKYVTEIIDEYPQMSFDYYMTVSGLSTGDYRFIAWGSLKDIYSISSEKFIPGETSFNEVEVYLNTIKNGLVTDSITPLFFATYNNNNTYPISAMKSQTIDLDMVQNTYRINVEVAGLDEVSLLNSYQFNISDDNGRYNFDNSFASCEKFKYTANCSRNMNNDELFSGLTVMRIAGNRSPMLNVSRSDADFPLVEDNLVELILAASSAGANIDFEKHFTFDIRYELNPEVPGTIIIYVNGWRIVKQDGIVLY